MKRITHRRRLEQLDQLLETLTEKRFAFEREIVRASSPEEKLKYQDKVRNDVIPDLKLYEQEYSAILADVLEESPIHAPEAAAVVDTISAAAARLKSVEVLSHEAGGALDQLASAAADSTSAPAEKLKVCLPLIPMIASYEVELDTDRFFGRLWTQIKHLVVGDPDFISYSLGNDFPAHNDYARLIEAPNSGDSLTRTLNPDQSWSDFANSVAQLSLDVTSRVTGLITGSFSDPSNEFSQRNRRLLEYFKAQDASELRGLAFQGLHDVVEALLGDLEHQIAERSRASRFICTNSTVEQLGISSWNEDNAIRRLVTGSRSALVRSGVHLECWRVFIVQNPSDLRGPLKLSLFYSALEENRAIGIHPAVFSAHALPPGYSYRYADFYCIPDRLVFVSVVPVYLLTKFDRSDQDRPVLNYYSELCEHLIESCRWGPDECGFVWQGGIQEDLSDRLKALR